MHGDIETYYDNGQWNNRAQGDPAVISEHPTKQGAMDAGAALASARKVEHVIKNKDGTIGQRNSYGNDPRDRAG